MKRPQEFPCQNKKKPTCVACGADSLLTSGKKAFQHGCTCFGGVCCHQVRETDQNAVLGNYRPSINSAPLPTAVTVNLTRSHRENCAHRYFLGGGEHANHVHEHPSMPRFVSVDVKIGTFPDDRSGVLWSGFLALRPHTQTFSEPAPPLRNETLATLMIWVWSSS